MITSFYQIVLLSAVIFLILLAFIWRLHKHFIDKLNKQEREKIHFILEAQENERQIIAKEVHDNLGPLLSITNMQLEKLISQTPIQQSPEYLLQLQKQLKNAITICRNVSHKLTPYLDKSERLEDVLSDYISIIDQSGKVNIHYKYAAEVFNMDSPLSISLCRILFELINNAIKHANASEINIVIDTNNNELTLNFLDNGIGFNRTMVKSGLGLKNIESRVHMLSGRLEYNRYPDMSGMQIIVHLPLN